MLIEFLVTFRVNVCVCVALFEEENDGKKDHPKEQDNHDYSEMCLMMEKIESNGQLKAGKHASIVLCLQTKRRFSGISLAKEKLSSGPIH